MSRRTASHLPMHDDSKPAGAGPLHGAEREIECEEELSEPEVSDLQDLHLPKQLAEEGSEPLRRRLKLADRSPRRGGACAPVVPPKRFR